jgi:hypothetical protein
MAAEGSVVTVYLSCIPDIFQTLHITVKYYASVYLNGILMPRFVFRQRIWLIYAAMSYLLQV